MKFVFNGVDNYKSLDYISCWFFLGSKYIKNINAKLAFVSTNSLCQGEQVSLLWSHIFNINIEISFAYQSFKWQNNAKDNAGVSVVIIGLRNVSNEKKFIFNENIKKESKNINAYLINSSEIIITKQSKSISNLPNMMSGNKPVDGGNLIFSEEEKNLILLKNPNSSKYIKKFMGADEFMNGKLRYCLWIEDNQVDDANNNELIMKRIEETKKFRLSSKDIGANQLAVKSHKFRDFIVLFKPLKCNSYIFSSFVLH